VAGSDHSDPSLLQRWCIRVAAFALLAQPIVLLVQAYHLGGDLAAEAVGGLWRRLIIIGIVAGGLLARQTWAWWLALLGCLTCGLWDVLSMLIGGGATGIEMTPLRDYGPVAAWLTVGSQGLALVGLLLGGRQSPRAPSTNAKSEGV
jgi:hypothetical protein